ncbi:hypothetical protein DIPPA_06905 [Diplonema papillatum]|nr:hypothetical protein DIPPA_06905 [Diplonema papillatum]
MTFEILWPTKWADGTEQALCDRLKRALQNAKPDPSLIRGQFEPKRVCLGRVAPQLRLVSLNHVRFDSVKLELTVDYNDGLESGLKVEIDGAEIALTGTEGDYSGVDQHKLWYPVEVTLYNIKVHAQVVAEVINNAPTGKTLSHRPPPASALHELQVGRLKAARAPPRSATPGSDSQSGGIRRVPSTDIDAASHLQSLSADAGGQLTAGDMLDVPYARNSSKLNPGYQPKGTGFGLAYASRRVHYPKYPRNGAHKTAHRGATPSHAPLEAAAGFGAREAGMRAVPSLLSLSDERMSTGSFTGAISSPPASVSTSPYETRWGAQIPRPMQHSSSMQGFPSMTSFGSRAAYGSSFPGHHRQPTPFASAALLPPDSGNAAGSFSDRPPAYGRFGISGNSAFAPPHANPSLTLGTPPAAGHRASGIDVRLCLAAVPDVDFSLRTNFRTLRGADNQARNALKSLLRPKLEETLRGIIIHLPEGTVEVGPEKSPVGSPVSSKSGYHDRAAALR